jgi:hypothetical protein
LYGLVIFIAGFDSAAGRLGTVGTVEDDACSVLAAVVGNVGVDAAAIVVASAPLSQGFGGETIAIFVAVE